MNEAEMKDRPAKEIFWQGHIAEWKTSGLSQRVYCHNNHLAVATFGYWRRKLKLQLCQPDKPRFYPLAVSGPLQPGSLQNGEKSIRLVLDENRFTIEVDDDFSPATLQRLVLALEQI